MRALCWEGKGRVELRTVPDPEIVNPHDAVVRITSTAICGSDLHLYGGYVPSMRKGDVLGHEFMGEVAAVGAQVRTMKPGDRVVVSAVISCGECFYCAQELYSLCENTNPNATLEEKAYGSHTAAIFGYSHLYGGYAGGQAEYARVPFADVNALKVESGIPDEKVLFLSDILPTGWMAAENCGIRGGETVAVWGCGPVGQFAIAAAYLLGAERVIAIDRFPERLEMAREKGGATALNYEDHKDLVEDLKEMTGGRGPDACIDAVGMEAHGFSADAKMDRALQAVRLETDRSNVLRQVLQACRKGGTVSIPGVYGGIVDKLPLGAAFTKSLTLKMGQTHTPRYMRPLLERVERGDIDPSFVITHPRALGEGPVCYEMFQRKEDACVKFVLKP